MNALTLVFVTIAAVMAGVLVGDIIDAPGRRTLVGARAATPQHPAVLIPLRKFCRGVLGAVLRVASKIRR